MELRHTTATPQPVAPRNVSPADQAASDAVNSEPTSRHVATSNELPPRVMNSTSNAHQPDKAATTPPQNSDSVSAISGAQTVELPIAPSITRAQLTPGDLVFKVGTERSNATYQKIMAHQKKTIVPQYTSNQNLIPVPLHRVTHCDISVGDGLLAKVGGPRNNKEWALLGKQTPTHFLPMEKLKGYSDSFVVLCSGIVNLAT